MNNPYETDFHSVERLVNEYRHYGDLVIAYDFDNTVYDCHGHGHNYDRLINLLRKCKEHKFYLIVFTLNTNLDLVKSHLADNAIPYDAINENPPFFKTTSPKKIYYNLLLDDRAGLPSAMKHLETLLGHIEGNVL